MKRAIGIAAGVLGGIILAGCSGGSTTPTTLPPITVPSHPTSAPSSTTAGSSTAPGHNSTTTTIAINYSPITKAAAATAVAQTDALARSVHQYLPVIIKSSKTVTLAHNAAWFAMTTSAAHLETKLELYQSMLHLQRWPTKLMTALIAPTDGQISAAIDDCIGLSSKNAGGEEARALTRSLGVDVSQISHFMSQLAEHFGLKVPSFVYSPPVVLAP